MEKCSKIFREATDEEMREHTPENKPLIKYGSYYSSLVVECKLFLPWALKKYVIRYSKQLNYTLQA